MERYDVAIVGAGPAGSAAAISLARAGHEVLLIDKQKFPREKLCGDFLNPVNWPVLERLGVADDILSQEHRKISHFRISSCGGSQAVAALSAPGRGRAFGLGLRRSILDDTLLHRAKTEGAEVRTGVALRDVRRSADGWRLNVARDETEERLTARVLIGADGRNSRTAHRLGLARPNELDAKHVGVQSQVKNAAETDDGVHIHLFPGGYAGLVGVGGGLTNVCFTIDKKTLKECSSVTELWEKTLYRNRILKEQLGRGEIVAPIRTAFPVYFAPRRCYGDGFLLAGDAARVTEPVTGEGVYFALRSGELAAETVARALRRGDLSARALSAYARDCRSWFARRRAVNHLVRAVVRRPALASALVRFSAAVPVPMNSLVRAVCAA